MTQTDIRTGKKPGGLDRYFALSERGTSTRTEILAGFTTFLTMAYIVLVNPAILGQAGMPVASVAAATCFAAAFASILMGVVANTPLALAPGMGLNAYFSFTVVQQMGVPVIYFGVETAGLLGAMAETGADVIGLDWRQPLDEGWHAVGYSRGVQGNLDPITLFAPLEILEQRVKDVLRSAGGRPGHIFNLGHGIVPNTPVENVQAVVRMVRDFHRQQAIPEQANG